ncbi:ankyrin repeat domain-containing protein 13C-like isoform X2 [Dysidea avara]|uniref:ankyrin repeat domain-containing protein 13C-like isoform X2 n=1 Tax=Dysidea avara TaxID=196820 RepID=UPI003322AEE5
MATSLLTTGDGKDEVDGIFPRRRPSTFSYYEIEDSVANFDSATSKEDFALHYAVFQGDLNAVQKLITKDNKDSLDTHGNTPLHIAIMKGYTEIIDLLLKHNVAVKIKNCDGWLPLDEAISYGKRETIAAVLKKFREQYVDGLVSRKKDLMSNLNELGDFYAELKWEFHTWVPFLSRLLPSDLCKIHKCGEKIRVDCTLMDFNEMSWQRGDLSFVFNGEDQNNAKNFIMTIMDNKKREFQKIKLFGAENVDVDLDEQIDLLMSRPVVYANMSTKPIKVSRAQSGFLFFRSDKVETVGEYEAQVYDISDLILLSRKRTEHLSSEDKQQHEHMRKKLEAGDLSSKDLEQSDEVKEVRKSLSPPPQSTVTWDDYISGYESADKRRRVHPGRPIEYHEERRTYKASTAIADSCLLDVSKLLDILEVIVPYKHFQKLRDFINLKLLPDRGFPVKLNVPVFPTVTAIVTLESFQAQQTSAEKFLVPRDYKKFDIKAALKKK